MNIDNYKPEDSHSVVDLKNEIENLSDESVPLTDFSEFIERLHGFAKYLTDLSKGEAAAPPTAGASASDIFSPDEPEELRTVKVTFSEPFHFGLGVLMVATPFLSISILSCLLPVTVHLSLERSWSSSDAYLSSSIGLN